MAKETVVLGVANEGEKSISIEELNTWNPKNVNYFSDVVYFSNDKVYYSIKRVLFDKIFKNKIWVSLNQLKEIILSTK